MSDTATLFARNQEFAKTYDGANMPPVPQMATVILCCLDARVDPAHVLGLDLGEAVVIRNTGGRVTPEVIEQIGALAFMVAMMNDNKPYPFEVVVMQHTQCGAQHFANPDFQAAMLKNTGVDVSDLAISDHDQSVLSDIEKLRAATEIPGHITASGYVYDIATASIREVAAKQSLVA